LPELSLSIIGKFYLNGPVTITIAPEPQRTADPCLEADAHWKATESIGTVAAYEDHIARFSSCAFASLAKARIDAFKQKTAAIAPHPLPAPMAMSGGYDGEWDVLVSCTPVGKVAGYSTTLAGGVKDRAFHAEAGTSGNPGWIEMNGKIGPDGKTTLFAKGLTGVSSATLHNPKPGSPYGYTVSAKFDEGSGAGKRNEDRPCTVNFSKR
jgi:hypothetical protein